jgi:hypothetical protein
VSKISIKGVLVGGIVDIVTTEILAFPLLIVVAARANISALPKAQQTQVLTAAIHDSSMFFLTGLIAGSLASILAGYVAARIAKSEALLNGALSSWLCVAVGIYSMLGKSDSMTPTQHVLYLLASPVLGALGGALWQRTAMKAGANQGASQQVA